MRHSVVMYDAWEILWGLLPKLRLVARWVMHSVDCIFQVGVFLLYFLVIEAMYGTHSPIEMAYYDNTEGSVS